MDQQTIQKLVTQQFAGQLSYINQVFMPDESYKTVSQSLVSEVLQNTNVEEYKYTKAIFDCDDFAHLLKAEFIKRAYKDGVRYPYAFGIVWAKVKVDGQWFGHAINWFIDPDEKIWLVEPQRDLIYHPRQENIGDIYFLLV